MKDVNILYFACSYDEHGDFSVSGFGRVMKQSAQDASRKGRSKRVQAARKMSKRLEALRQRQRTVIEQSLAKLNLSGVTLICASAVSSR